MSFEVARLTPTEPFLQVLQPDPDSLPPRERVITVSGTEWTAFFDKVEAALDKSVVPQGWENRVLPAELKSSRVDWGSHEKTWKDFRRLHFWAAEAPLSGAAAEFTRQADYYLRLNASPPRYLETYCYPRLKSMGLGSGFYGIPRAFAYPYFRFCPWLIGAAFLLYVLLPWPKRAPSVAVMARWRVVLGDAASSTLLFGSFFAMPLFIVGSSRQAAGEYLGFSMFFWGLSSLGLLLLHWGALWGTYNVAVLADRLIISDLKGSREFPFRELASVQPASFRPPVWLIRTLMVLALLGGRRGLLAAGQAGLMAASEGKGYLLRAKDGRLAYIWYTDPMGNPALEHFDEVEKALERSGAPKTPETLALRGVFPRFR